MTSRIVQFLEYIGHPIPAGAKVGHAAKMTCPFHDDSNPSAKVYPMTDTIHCFACNKTWTVETAWMRYFHVGWNVAVAETAKLFPGGYSLSEKAEPTLVRRYEGGLTPVSVNAFADYLRSKVLRERLPRDFLVSIAQVLKSEQPLTDVFLNLQSIYNRMEVYDARV